MLHRLLNALILLPDKYCYQVPTDLGLSAAEATAPSQDAVSIEDQIAEWEARYAEATPGSDEWCDARDALERLQRPQERS